MALSIWVAVSANWPEITQTQADLDRVRRDGGIKPERCRRQAEPERTGAADDDFLHDFLPVLANGQNDPLRLSSFRSRPSATCQKAHGQVGRGPRGVALCPERAPSVQWAIAAVRGETMPAAKTYEAIKVEKDQGITWLMINRPDKR